MIQCLVDSLPARNERNRSRICIYVPGRAKELLQESLPSSVSSSLHDEKGKVGEENMLTPLKLFYRDQTGFSLIEVLVALVIISISLVGLTSVFSQSFQMKRFAHDITLATLLGQEILDQYIFPLYPPSPSFETAPSEFRSFTDEQGKPIFPRFRWQTKTERDQQGRVTLRVSIYWPWPENRHHLEFVTYVPIP